MSKKVKLYYTTNGQTIVNLEKAPLIYSIVLANQNAIFTGTENARKNSKELGSRRHSRVFIPESLLQIIKKSYGIKEKTVKVFLTSISLVCEICADGNFIPIKDVDVILDYKKEPEQIQEEQ